MATIHGAESLGLNAGLIKAGCLADLVLIDLDAPTLAGCREAELAPALILGAAEECIAGTIVGGRP